MCSRGTTSRLASLILICLAHIYREVCLQQLTFGYVFQEYAEGNLLDHIASRRDYYLSCVFAVVREWHMDGMRRTSKVEHDFREWLVSWITSSPRFINYLRC
jgi:hypothetical protein